MACAELLNTQAYIDGELEGAAAEACERHIETCAECQAFCADAAAISEDISRLALRHAAPAALKTRVAQTLNVEKGRKTDLSMSTRRAARRSFWRGAFSGVLGGAGVSGLLAAMVVTAILPPPPDALADQLTQAHTRALISGRTIAVVSSDHHTVRPWFAGRIDLAPPVADFAAQGFKLVGGRLDRAAGQPAAVVVYQLRRHEIDLFVWTDRGGALPATALSHGYHLVLWRRGDLDFAAVSDAQADDLARFAALVQAEPE
ncbi:MAG: anti-sigma factor [Caulobacteraceae bacterium]|nr:anti-sigma factor [Caulobacteraceae bacterium]